MSNNSSVNYLNRTNSTFLKDKLNNNNILINTNQTSTISTNNINNQIINIPISKINNTNNKNDYVRISNRLYRKTRKDNLGNNINDKNIIESTESIQDIILNKSNKSDILLIKIYSVITYILLILIIIYSVLKLIITLKLLNNYANIFSIINLITNRYSLLNYYFNIIKIIIIFPIKEAEQSLSNCLNEFEDLNEKFDKIVNEKLDSLYEVKELFDLIKDSKNNSTELLNSNLCKNIDLCYKYINSPYNIMGTGVDFLYKSLIIDISKLYLDYKGIKNKTDITKIQEIIITNKFLLAGLYVGYGYYYIKFGIFDAFKNDEETFRNKFKIKTEYLNIVTVIFAIFSFLFVVIFIFLTLSMYAEPIRKSAYRICRSFYYIKIYNIFNYRKSTIQ